MTIEGKNLTLDEFRRYARNYDFGRIKPSWLVIHHTWSPTKAQWRGATSVAGLKSYYESKGWSAGPHLFIAEDGVWLFTPMSKVGIHAGEGNAKYLFGMLKGYSIGIEVVGDYDAEKWTGETYKNAIGVINVLMEVLGIKNEDIFFHRDYPSAKKSCPGWAITKEWLGAELAKTDAMGQVVMNTNTSISSWAQDGWQWAQGLGLDISVRPQQTVTAEWVFAILKKYHDIKH